MKTQTKVLLTSSLLCLLALTLGYQWGDRLGLFLGLVGSLAFLGFFFLQGDESVLSFYRAHALSGQDPWKIVELVEAISKAERFRTPEVFVFEHPHLSLFSYWPLAGAPRICISTGCLEKLSADEHRLLIIHQILFLKSTNTNRHQFLHRLCRSIVQLGRALDYLNPLKIRRPLEIFFFERFLGGWADAILKFVFHSKLYENVDMMTSERTQERDLLGELLWRMKNLNETQPLPLFPCTRHLFFLDPRIKTSQIRKRITKLVGYYPI